MSLYVIPLQESNLKHSINGFMYCNLPGLQAKMGQRVRFYVMSLGTEVGDRLSAAVMLRHTQRRFGEPGDQHEIVLGDNMSNVSDSPRQLQLQLRSQLLCHLLQVDLHTPNLEAATLDWQGQGVSSLFFLPGNMETADAQLTAEGRWLFRCRVADHVGAGMEVNHRAKKMNHVCRCSESHLELVCSHVLDGSWQCFGCLSCSHQVC